jgi:hypothetical protein
MRHVTYDGWEKYETKKLKRNHFRILYKYLSVTVILILQQQYEGEDWINWLTIWPRTRTL